MQKGDSDLKSPMTFTALRVNTFGAVPAVEIHCYDEKEKTTTECLFLQPPGKKPVILGAEYFHPLLRAEMTVVANEAIKVGKSKLQQEQDLAISQMESSRKRQLSRSSQFRDAIAGWSRELLALNESVRNGLDTPTIRSRIGSLVSAMEKYNPKK